MLETLATARIKDNGNKPPAVLSSTTDPPVTMIESLCGAFSGCRKTAINSYQVSTTLLMMPFLGYY